MTELNRPILPDSTNPAVVAREKLAEAEEAYVLSSDREGDLSKLVGDRVHVDGTLARSAALPGTQPEAGGGAVGTAGQSGEVKALESGRVIKEKDLAEVHVTSVEKMADTCGTHAARKTPRS